MSQPTSGNNSQRKIWIGTGLAAVAVAVAGVYVWDTPSTDGVSGTIVPAQRYRAPQGTEVFRVEIERAHTGAMQAVYEARVALETAQGATR